RVMVNVPYKMNGDMPQMVPRGTEGAKQHDFRKGIYTVEAEAGRSWTSRIQQGQEQWPALIQALGPEAGLVLAPTLLDFSDTPGSAEAADLMRKYRDSKMPFLVDDGQELTSDQLKAKLAAATQRMKQQEQMLQAAAMEVKTDQEKQKAQIVKNQMDAETSAAKTQSDNETKLAIATLNSQTQIAIAELQ